MTLVAGPSILRSTTGLSTTPLDWSRCHGNLTCHCRSKKVEEITRKQLRRLVAEDKALELTSYELQRLLGTTQPA